MPADDNKQRRRELAAIHVARQQLGLEDGDYRDLLEEWTGKRSAGDLTSPERHRVLGYLRQMGFRRKNPEPSGDPSAGSGSPGERVAIADDDRPQVRKIKALWLALHRMHGGVRDPSPKALARYVKRVVGIDQVHWLTPAAANIIIESLKAWLARIQEAHHQEEDEHGNS